jgi:hypothetical protein
MTAAFRRLASLGAFVFATAPVAATALPTLSIELDQASYTPGDTITMTIRGDSDGALSYFGFGRLEYSAAALSNPSVVRYVPPADRTGEWLLGGAALGCNPTNCFVINMIWPYLPNPPSAPWPTAGVDPSAEPFVYGVVTATAGTPGTYTIGWNTDIGSGFELDFFGLTNAPPATLQTNAPSITFQIIPEPSTAALVAFGMLALAGSRSSRRSR